MSMDLLIGEVLGQVRTIARDVVQREGTRLRTATVTSVDPLRIRYDGEADPSVVTPRTVAPASTGARVVVAKAHGQATILGAFTGSSGAGPYSPRVAGIVGDGVTDDTAAWNAFLAALPDDAIVQCPEGDRYRLTGSVALSRPVTIRGGDFLAWTGGATLLLDADDITLESVTITGPGAGTAPVEAAKFVQTTGTASAPLSGLRIDGMTVTGCPHSMLWLSWLRDFSITRSYFGGFQYAAIMLLSPKNGTVTDNRVATAVQSSPLVNSYGIAATDLTNDASGRAENVIISGNQITDIPDWEGIDTHGGRGIIITDNTVVGCRTPIAVTSGNTARVMAPEGCVVQGNVLIKGNANSETAGIVYDGSKSTSGALATGVIGANTILGYQTDLILERYQPDRMSVLPQSSDAVTLRAPTPAPFRSWYAETVISTTNGAGTMQVAFPAAMFTAAPIVIATKQSGAGARSTPYVVDITTAGCTVGLYDPTATAAGATDVPVAIAVIQARRNGRGTPAA